MPTSAERGRWAPLRYWVAAATVFTTVAAAVALTSFRPASGPAAPAPGVPLLRQVELGDRAIPVLVLPHRPGPNLVQVAGTDVTVGLAPDRLVAATARPGAAGTWAVIDLPVGRSELWVGQAGQVASVTVDPGPARAAGPATPSDVTGPDGPECASAALAGLAAGELAPLVSCPAEALSVPERSALQAMVRFLADRGNETVTLVADDSPRSHAAERLVTAASQRVGMALGTTGAVVVVAGWAGAQLALRDIADGRRAAPEGAYLAPWLFHAPVLDQSVGMLLSLPYAPQAASAENYLVALASVSPGSSPSGSGYLAWLGAHGQIPTGPVKLYAAAARITVPGAGHGHGGLRWLPDGSVVAVTGAVGD